MLHQDTAGSLSPGSRRNSPRGFVQEVLVPPPLSSRFRFSSHAVPTGSARLGSAGPVSDNLVSGNLEVSG